MTEPIYRYATADDIPAIRALVELAYRGPESAKGWSSEAHLLAGERTSIEEVTELFDAPHARFLLAETDGDLSGCVLIEKHGDDGYFGMFSVNPRLQNSGLGRALLDRAEQSVRDLWHVETMTAVVIDVRHELLAWYERRGYVITGELEPFPFDEHSGALRTDFAFVKLRKQL